MTDQNAISAVPNAIGKTGFFKDTGFDFVTRSMIGYAAQGVMDIGQVFATIANVTDAMPTVGTPRGEKRLRNFTHRQAFPPDI